MEKKDKYVDEKVKPLIEDFKAVWDLTGKDEWIKEVKRTLTVLINKVYEDGFQDGVNEVSENPQQIQDFRDIDERLTDLLQDAGFKIQEIGWIKGNGTNGASFFDGECLIDVEINDFPDEEVLEQSGFKYEE